MEFRESTLFLVVDQLPDNESYEFIALVSDEGRAQDLEREGYDAKIIEINMDKIISSLERLGIIS